MGGVIEIRVVGGVTVDEGQPAAHGLIAVLRGSHGVQAQRRSNNLARQDSVSVESVVRKRTPVRCINSPRCSPTLARVMVGATGWALTEEQSSDAGSTVPARLAMVQVSERRRNVR